MTLPPGFRFHPTDDELIGYYLKRKVDGLEIELEVIPVIELYKFDPWELPDKSFLPKRDMEWFFFCPRDRKYPNGSRTNRATCSGYWKATGKDRKIVCEPSVFGLRKTLVFYLGRAPGGERTDWVMHEYRLCEDLSQAALNFVGAFALCRIVKRNDSGLKINHNGEFNAKRCHVSPMPDFKTIGHANNLLDCIDDSSSLVMNVSKKSKGSTLVTSPESETIDAQQQIMQDHESGISESHIVSDSSKTSSPDHSLSLTDTTESCNILPITSYFNFPDESLLVNEFHANQYLPSYPNPIINSSELGNPFSNLECQGSKYFQQYNGCESWNSLPSISICRQASEEEAQLHWWLPEENLVLT